MTWLDSGGQKSGSQQAVEVAKAFTSMLGRQIPSSSILTIRFVTAWMLEMWYCL